MSSAIFKTKVYPSFEAAARDLRAQLTQAYTQLGANALDFGGLSFLKTNAGGFYDPATIETNEETIAALGITDEAIAATKMAAIIVQNIPTSADGSTIKGNDGKEYKIPKMVSLQAAPKAAAILADQSAQAKKFVTHCVRTGLLGNMKSQFRAMLKDGMELPSNDASFMVTPEQGNPETAFNAMFATLQTVLVNSAAADPRVANQVNKNTVKKDSLRSAFESQAAADALFPAIDAAHWDALLQRAAQVAPSFTKDFPVKGEDGKALKERNEAGKEVTVKEARAFPQRPDIFLHWLETRHEVASDVETAKMADLDFASMNA